MRLVAESLAQRAEARGAILPRPEGQGLSRILVKYNHFRIAHGSGDSTNGKVAFSGTFSKAARK